MIELLTTCSETYHLENIQWIVVDVTHLKFEGNTFDMYTSYEALEHLPLDKVERYFQQAKRILKNGAQFIISTPNRENRININNPFHVKEYTFTEFQNMMGKHFDKVEFYSLEEARLYKGVSKNSTGLIVLAGKKVIDEVHRKYD